MCSNHLYNPEIQEEPLTKGRPVLSFTLELTNVQRNENRFQQNLDYEYYGLRRSVEGKLLHDYEVKYNERNGTSPFRRVGLIMC